MTAKMLHAELQELDRKIREYPWRFIASPCTVVHDLREVTTFWEWLKRNPNVGGVDYSPATVGEWASRNGIQTLLEAEGVTLAKKPLLYLWITLLAESRNSFQTKDSSRHGAAVDALADFLFWTTNPLMPPPTDERDRVAKNKDAQRYLRNYERWSKLKPKRKTRENGRGEPNTFYDWTLSSHTQATIRSATGASKRTVVAYLKGLGHEELNGQYFYGKAEALIVLDRWLGKRKSKSQQIAEEIWRWAKYDQRRRCPDSFNSLHKILSKYASCEESPGAPGMLQKLFPGQS